MGASAVLQRLRAVLGFLVADRSGLLRFLYNNVKNAAYPVVTIYLILHFLALRGRDRADYLLFVFVGVFYVLASVSVAERVTQWFHVEQRRGTLDTVCMTRLSLGGTLRYLFAAHLLVYVVTEVPLFWLAARLLWGLDVTAAAGWQLALLGLLTLLVGYGAALVLVALTLVLDAAVTDISLRKFAINILAGVYCPVRLFPAWLRPVSYALPFTHGLELLRRLLEPADPAPALLDFAPLAAFAVALVAGGQLALVRAGRHVRRRGSLVRY